MADGGKAEAACPHSVWVELTWHWVLILQALLGRVGAGALSAMVSLSVPQPDPGPCEAPNPLATILPSAPQLHWLTTGPWCELTSLELSLSFLGVWVCPSHQGLV